MYVLVGPPEESGLPRVYVGEGDPIRPRLEQHAGKKDFWTSCIAFTNKDENLFPVLGLSFLTSAAPVERNAKPLFVGAKKIMAEAS